MEMLINLTVSVEDNIFTAIKDLSHVDSLNKVKDRCTIAKVVAIQQYPWHTTVLLLLLCSTIPCSPSLLT